VIKEYSRIKLKKFSLKIADFLEKSFSKENGFNCREYYGTAFSIWLWSLLGKDFDKVRLEALEYLSTITPPSFGRQYHWEFVRFALGEAKNLGGLGAYSSTKQLLGDEKFCRTRVANWTMLRSTVRLRDGGFFNKLLAHLERHIALLVFQRSSGFIEDTRCDPTSQYHAFSTALLGLQILRSPIAKRMHIKRFSKAINALDRLVFPSGDSNVLGRGQKQSFGYSASILAYILAGEIFSNSYYIEKSFLIEKYISSFFRGNHSIPLVLRKGEKFVISEVDTTDPEFSGWYSYNNFFDYLSFTGALIAFSYEIFEKSKLNKTNILKNKKYIPLESTKNAHTDDIQDSIRIIKKSKYCAIVVPPGKSLAGGMPLPFIELADGVQPLPCYGGEMHQPSLYRPEGLPLPALVGTKESQLEVLYCPGRYRWVTTDQFVGKGPGWTHFRRVIAENDFIVIEDEVEFERGFPENKSLMMPRFLLLADDVLEAGDQIVRGRGITVQADAPLSEEVDPQWCALGQLKVFSARRPAHTMRSKSSILISIC